MIVKLPGDVYTTLIKLRRTYLNDTNLFIDIVQGNCTVKTRDSIIWLNHYFKGSYEILMVALVNGFESTRIITYRGRQYQLAKRNAVVGELVIITCGHISQDYHDEGIYEVSHTVNGIVGFHNDKNEVSEMLPKEYHVLEEIK